MARALTISRFRIPFAEARKYEGMLEAPKSVAEGVDGYISTSVWREVNDRDSYLRLTFFRDVTAMDQFYDKINRSQALIDSINKYGIAPDVQRCEVFELIRMAPNRIHESEFLSLSIRAMDPGHGVDWAEKLSMNLQEVSTIPGFEGAAVASGESVPDEIVGLALWQTPDSFKRSVPDRPDYEISLYELYR